ncbi:hypothetical protein PP459_gp084 [Streptomyces phage Wakanda]|uniref:Uncharacterized protein n=1 Tax=Streptomyces phage Wakanda TaxID=2713267 RepID=A0A6G8R1S6_9CAUD|nr:hypothetical protein PP459_gp084 [Streptomyces phage Wakanda]QIN94149.1 hypothetical protein SEA_WAKANDA_188 [Streptomyces phage Wakanda]
MTVKVFKVGDRVCWPSCPIMTGTVVKVRRGFIRNTYVVDWDGENNTQGAHRYYELERI